MSKRSKTQFESGSKLSTGPFINPFAWKHISQENITYLESQTPEQIENFFSQTFNLKNHETDLRQASVLEFYFGQYWWAARERAFSPEQISTYFTIVFNLFNSLKEQERKLSSLVDEFKNELGQVSKLFDDDQIRDILSYVSTSLIENYRIYEFVLNQDQPELVVSKQLQVECPDQLIKPYPAPLDEAIPEYIFKKHVLKIADEDESKSVENIEKHPIDTIELTDDVIEEINNRFGDISIEEAKRIIVEVTDELVADLKAEVQSKLRQQQSDLLNELSKKQTKSTQKMHK